MTLYSIDVTIPAANNDPADDQPLMKQNFANISAYVAVDHVDAGNQNAGQHKQVNIPANVIPGALPTALAGVLYTQPGVAAPAASQMAYKSSLGTFPLSCVRAFGSCTVIGATVTTNNMFNLNGTVNTRVTRSANGNFLVNLVTDAVSSTDYGVLVSCQLRNDFAVGAIAGYTINNITQFQLNFTVLNGGQTAANPAFFSFVVYQI